MRCYLMWTQVSLIWYQENTADEPRRSERRQGLLTTLLCLIVHLVEIQTQLLTGRKDAFVLTYHIISLWFLEWGDRDRTVNDTTRNGLCHEVAFYPGTGEGTRHSVWCFGWKSARCIAVFSHVVPWRRLQNQHNFHSHVESKYHFPLLQTLKSKLSFGIADISVQSDANRQW